MDTTTQKNQIKKSSDEKNAIVNQCIDMILFMHRKRTLFYVFVFTFYLLIAILVIGTSIWIWSGAGFLIGVGGTILFIVLHVLASLQTIESDEVGALLFFGAPIWQLDSGLALVPLGFTELKKDKKSFTQILFGAPYKDSKGNEIDPRGKDSKNTYLLVDSSLIVQFGTYLDDEDGSIEGDQKDPRAQAIPTQPHLGARYYIAPDPITRFDMKNEFEEVMNKRGLNLEPEPCGYAIFISVVNSINEVNDSIRETAVASLVQWAGKHSAAYTLRNLDKAEERITTAVEVRVGELSDKENPKRANVWWGIDLEKVWIAGIGLPSDVDQSLTDASKAFGDAAARSREGEGEKQYLTQVGYGNAEAEKALLTARAEGVKALAKELDSEEAIIAYQLDQLVDMFQNGNVDMNLFGTDLASTLGAVLSKYLPNK